jgi:stalled ribosome rescue protein Dom34
MNKKTGIWIDSKKAVIVNVSNDIPQVSVIESDINSRERIPGKGKWYTRFGRQFINFEKRKQRRHQHEVTLYLRNVKEALDNPEELVVFGPGLIKTELEKMIHNDPALQDTLKYVETTDSMTENQMVAWVKDFFENKYSAH